jgi:uncharacterized damage-inducible protein DinB
LKIVKQRDNLLLAPLNGYAEPVGIWLSALQDARKRTLRALKNIEPQWLDLAPEAGGESIGTILYHIAAIEASWFYEEALQAPFPPEIDTLFPHDVRDDDGRLTPVTDSLENHLKRLESVREKLLDGFSKISSAEFAAARHLSDYDVSPVYVLHHLMQHEAEHRSQINLLAMKAKAVLGDKSPKEKL